MGKKSFTLWRDKKHDHFWVQSGQLYESYRTLRGLRWRGRGYAPQGFPDTDRLTDEQIATIEKDCVLTS